VKWIHNGVELATEGSCIPLAYRIEEVGDLNSGEHICETTNALGQRFTYSAEILNIIGKGLITMLLAVVRFNDLISWMAIVIIGF